MVTACEQGPAAGRPVKKPLHMASKALFLSVIVGLAFLAPGGTSEIVREALAEAYIAVSTFVAATLAIFYVLEHAFKLDTAHLLEKYRRFQIPIAAIMGALPGCGGAIIVITQYVAGRLSFGAVVAVLCSTMGDAAFLLLAQEPATALLIYALSTGAGIVTGYFVERVHGQDFLRCPDSVRVKTGKLGAFCGPGKVAGYLRWLWLALIIPGLVIGIGEAFQADTDAWFGAFGAFQPTLWAGVCGALLCVFLWAISPNSGPSITNLSGQVSGPHAYKHLIDRVMTDTNFVTAWVVTAFVAYELAAHWLGLDLGVFLQGWTLLLPLMATLVGFIPGCGPQVIVTTMYLAGAIPFSAQLANAISNDGDALFPAIALAPKAAILATLYTGIPALLISYGWLFLME
jgi:hypothetical protein